MKSSFDGKTHEGIIHIAKNGVGYFRVPENGVQTKSSKGQDLMIPPEWLSTCLPYDVVRVEEAGIIDRRKAGKVVEIVTRARTRFVGTIVKEHGHTLLHPDWKRMHVPFVLRDDASLPVGHKALVRFTEWQENMEYPRAEVEEIIGPAGVHETEMRALALAQGFESDFPPGVLKEAEYLEAHGKEILTQGSKEARRKDFREITTFTIDPIDAKDFDDALSVRTLENGDIEVGVHIADVSHFVRNGTSIDTEGRKRATSVYLVDRTIPMLPHVLSTNLCSLNPHEDRLAVSAVFVLDTQATIKERWFGETVIHSNKRFTYEEAQEVLEKQEGPYLAELNIVNDLAKKIRAGRQKKGAIDFDTQEVKIELDAEGVPVAIRLKERKATNLLIEDFMLLANESVAEFLSEKTKKKGLAHGVIYRVHDVPDAERIQNLSAFLKVLGYTLETTPEGGVKGVDLNKLLAEIKGTPEEYLIKTATLRSMAKATYTTKNHGHFGLAFSHYTHFTSPIRRYPDLLVHRMLKHVVHEEEVKKGELDELESLAIHSSEREIAAAEAERDSVKLKQVEYLARHIGEVFEGVISGVTERGIFVELTASRADGMVRIRDLGDDYFIFDEKRYRVVGERTKKTFSLGDSISVRLTAARPFERELDFELADILKK